MRRVSAEIRLQTNPKMHDYRPLKVTKAHFAKKKLLKIWRFQEKLRSLQSTYRIINLIKLYLPIERTLHQTN